MEMIDEFLTWFEGNFNNWNQASSRPTSFAHIILTHTRISEYEFHCMQRYSHEEKPYRDKIIKVVPGNPITIENDQCNLLFYKVGNVYRGTTVPGCIFKDTVLISRIELGEDYYVVIDAGLDPQTGKQVWGSTNGPFIFDKVINTLEGQ
jgi:CpeT protein